MVLIHTSVFFDIDTIFLGIVCYDCSATTVAEHFVVGWWLYTGVSLGRRLLKNEQAINLNFIQNICSNIWNKILFFIWNKSECYYLFELFNLLRVLFEQLKQNSWSLRTTRLLCGYDVYNGLVYSAQSSSRVVVRTSQ